MSTTTIRLTDELKARVAKAAQREGVSAHNFMLEAVSEKTELAERRADFYAEADRRWGEFLKTGESIPWVEMRRFLMGRIHGKPTPRPVARKFTK